jgi:NNP family nitrate/nitrite transporter-like MFS transporter
MLVSTLPQVAIVVPLLFLVMGMLGMGNGAVFQIAPQRFPAEIELITGIVGAAGGLGGFFLPSSLGILKDFWGTYAVGLRLFATLVGGALAILLEFGVHWNRTWSLSALERTGIFAYRRRQKTRAQSPVLDTAAE